MVKSVLYLLFSQSIFYFSSLARETAISTSQTEDSLSKVIHLTSTCIIKDNKVLLQWAAAGRIGFYIVERSVDLRGFEVIGVIKARMLDNHFEFIDEKPFLKKNYYRIKMQSDEKSFYSETVTAGITDSVFCKFYPNPVDKLLMLRSDYQAALKITDISGNTRLLQQIKPGVQILDVSGLEKNTYVITIFREESDQFISKKLIKN